MTKLHTSQIDMSAIESRLINADLLPSYPFIKDDWRSHLFESASHFIEKDFLILLKAINQVSDDESIYVVNYMLFPRKTATISEDVPVAWKIKPLWQAFDNEVQAAPCSGLGLYMYDTSQSWGVICTDADYLIVGGVDKFVCSLENDYGGADKIESDFISYLENDGPNMSKQFGEKLIHSIYGK